MPVCVVVEIVCRAVQGVKCVSQLLGFAALTPCPSPKGRRESFGPYRAARSSGPQPEIHRSGYPATEADRVLRAERQRQEQPGAGYALRRRTTPIHREFFGLHAAISPAAETLADLPSGSRCLITFPCELLVDPSYIEKGEKGGEKAGGIRPEEKERETFPAGSRTRPTIARRRLRRGPGDRRRSGPVPPPSLGRCNESAPRCAWRK